MYRKTRVLLRPSLPPLFIACVASILALRLMYARVVPPVLLFFVCAASLGGILIFYGRQKTTRKFACLSCALGVGLLLVGAANIVAQDAAGSALSHTPVSNLVLEAASDATSNDFGWSAKATAVHDGRVLGLVRLSLPEEVKAGERLRAIGSFQASRDSDDSYLQRLYAQGYVGQIKVSKITSRLGPVPLRLLPFSCRERLIAFFEPDKSSERALIAGMCLGYRAPLVKNGIQDTFSQVGIAHIIAVSGAHLVIVCTLAGVILEQCALTKKVKVALLCLLSAFYTLLCGAPIAAQRAQVMTSASSVADIAGRRASSIGALSLAGFILCYLGPVTALDIGFLLSFCSVAALAIFSRYAQAILKNLFAPIRAFLKRRAWRKRSLASGAAVHGSHSSSQSIPTHKDSRLGAYLRKRVRDSSHNLGTYGIQAASASIVCALAAAPLSASFFGRISVIGPLSALLTGPFIAPLMGFGLVAALVSFVPFVGPTLALAPLWVAEKCAACILQIANALSRIPGASFTCSIEEPWAILFLVGGASILYVLWRPPKAKLLYTGLVSALALVFFTSSVLPAFSPARIVVLNVGQGDAILVQEQNRAILVDTGPDASVVQKMRPFCVSHLDAIVITHQHADHYGGLSSVLQAIPTEQVFVGKGVSAHLCGDIKKACTATSVALQEIEDKKSFALGGWTFTCLWPKEASKGDENKDSICFSVSHARGLYTAFLTGDAEADVLEKIDNLPRGIALYKVGHHGSAVALTAQQAKRLSPKVSVASAGKNNKYGHPTKKCKDTLLEVGSRFICTMDAGSVWSEPQEIGIGLYADDSDALRKRA